MKLTHSLTEESLQDVIHINQGVYYPLHGFIGSSDYRCVLDNLRLSNGQVWSVPITLDVEKATYNQAKASDRLYLTLEGKEIGFIQIEDCFEVDTRRDAGKVFGTAEASHPGAAKEIGRSACRVGGTVTVTDKGVLKGALNPEKTRKIFADRGWKTVAAFHTRNPVHRAHEHLQRTALEICDGLFINPFLGWKKEGDFTDEAIMRGYRALIDNYYPKDSVYLEGFKSAMRYAGPREAVFHAIIRRNLGCTHMIVGRDHAGVGSYYGKYEAQDLCRKIASQSGLGIEFLLLKEPYYCERCGEVVSEKNCGHDIKYQTGISGTEIRKKLADNQRPDERFLRPEVADAIISLGNAKFIGHKE